MCALSPKRALTRSVTGAVILPPPLKKLALKLCPSAALRRERPVLLAVFKAIFRLYV